MRIRPPSYSLNGKIIVEYLGADLNPIYYSSIIENVVLHIRFEFNLSSNDFVLEFEILDGRKIRYCILSKKIYFEKNKDWVFFEDSEFIKCEILQNDNNIYFLGRFILDRFINEKYSFTAFFDKNSNFISMLIRDLSHVKLI